VVFFVASLALCGAGDWSNKLTSFPTEFFNRLTMQDSFFLLFGFIVL